MPKFDTSADRVRFARNISGLSRKELEQKFDINHNTLQSWELGRTQLTNKSAGKLCSVLLNTGILCSPDWLIHGDGQIPTILGFGVDNATSSNDELAILREVEAFKTINPDPIITIAQDDSMHPLYNTGDYIGGNKKHGDQIQRCINTCCIVETFEGDTLIRKVHKTRSKDLYTLSVINPNSSPPSVIPNIKLKYAAQIVWHRTREKLHPEDN